MPTKTVKSYLSMCRASGTQLNGEPFSYSYLKDQKASFYFLQETYCESSDENVWRKEWGGVVFFSHGSKHSRGVCILVDPSNKFKVDYSFTDNCGRIVLITLNFDCLRLSLCNIYAPNNVSEQLQSVYSRTQ